MIFARPAVGIEILGFRVGEYLILFGLLISVTFLFLPKNMLRFYTLTIFNFIATSLLFSHFFW